MRVHAITLRTKCAICWILLKERLRQRSIRLQSLLVQSRQHRTPVPSPAGLLGLSTRIQWPRCRLDFNGNWQLNKLTGKHPTQPTNYTGLHTWTFIMDIIHLVQTFMFPIGWTGTILLILTFHIAPSSGQSSVFCHFGL